MRTAKEMNTAYHLQSQKNAYFSDYHPNREDAVTIDPD